MKGSSYYIDAWRMRELTMEHILMLHCHHPLVIGGVKSLRSGYSQKNKVCLCGVMKAYGQCIEAGERTSSVTRTLMMSFGRTNMKNRGFEYGARNNRVGREFQKIFMGCCQISGAVKTERGAVGRY